MENTAVGQPVGTQEGGTKEGQPETPAQTDSLLSKLKSDDELSTLIESRVQSETDKRITQAQKTWDAGLTTRVSEAIAADKEARRIERAVKSGDLDPLLQAEKQRADGLSSELDALRAAAQLSELQSNVKNILIEKEVPELNDILLKTFSNIEDYSTAADSFKAILDKRVEAEVAKRLGTTPTIKPVGERQYAGDLYAQLAQAESAGDQLKVLEINNAIMDARK